MAESQLHCLEEAAGAIEIHVNTDKTEFEWFNQNRSGYISTLKGGSLKLVDKFIYLASSISFTENDINTRLTNAWTAIYRLSVIWKSDQSHKRKQFFQPAVVSILLYGCTTRTLTKHVEKKPSGNCKKCYRAVLNKSWMQHPTKLQLYGHLSSISKTIQIRPTRHAGHYWRDI